VDHGVNRRSLVGARTLNCLSAHMHVQALVGCIPRVCNSSRTRNDGVWAVSSNAPHDSRYTATVATPHTHTLTERRFCYIVIN
jgi:hypothetical protein